MRFPVCPRFHQRRFFSFAVQALKGVCMMGQILETFLYSITGTFFLIFVIAPAAIIFLGYAVFILVASIREWRR